MKCMPTEVLNMNLVRKNEGYAKLRLSQWQGDGINSTHTQNYDILSRCLMGLGEQHNVHYIM